MPAVLVAIVATVTLDRGLDRLFSQLTRQSLIENSLIVAEAYMREHDQIIRCRCDRDSGRCGPRQAIV